MQTYTVILFLLLASCRAPKDTVRHINQNARYQSEAGQKRRTWQLFDSAGRSWYYASDTSFYYHPDSGLHAIRGTLGVQESLLRSHYHSAIDDSSSAIVESTSAEHLKTKTKKSIWSQASNWGLIILLVAGVSGIVIWIKEKRKR